MGESLQAVTQFFVIFLALASVFIWTIRQPDLLLWSLRLALPAAAAALVWLLARNRFRKEILPDLLSQTVEKYFERDGFCFALVPTVENGICFANVFFQNRYSEACAADVQFRPGVKAFSLFRHRISGVLAKVDCPGGAFGVVRFQWPIPISYQGRTIRFDVGCSASYPNGAGNLLRFRSGIRCGSAGGDARRAVAGGALAMTGIVYMSRPARLIVRLPKNVADEPATGLPVATRILWQPDSPTRGFPVLPVAPGADS